MSSSIQPSRLVLFDIDGTLLTSSGAASRIFGEVLAEAAGRPVATTGYSMAGKTDRQIARDLLTLAGIGAVDIDALADQLLERYLDRLPGALAATPNVALFPGVHALLTRLAAIPQVLVGLLTGNLERGAAIKLERLGVRHFFRLGAYGSDAENRRALVEVAVRRAQALTGFRFSEREVVVIGDTPLDIDCGRAAGAITLAVATGPYGVEELARHAPDSLFSDFSDIERVVAEILGAGDGAGGDAVRGAGAGTGPVEEGSA
jgi:phosphoglycolate phosphatase-like HAD superfamily hydrolase